MTWLIFAAMHCIPLQPVRLSKNCIYRFHMPLVLALASRESQQKHGGMLPSNQPHLGLLGSCPLLNLITQVTKLGRKLGRDVVIGSLNFEFNSRKSAASQGAAVALTVKVFMTAFCSFSLWIKHK